MAGCEGATAASTVDAATRVADASSPTDASVPEDSATEPPATLGGDRPAKYYLPEGYDADAPAPMLLLLHGYSGTGGITAAWWQLVSAASEAGVILVVPEGLTDSRDNQFWNASEFCCDYDNTKVDDVAYLTGIIDEAQRFFAVDAQRIYLMGHSNGGFMGHRLACERSDLIAGLVNFAGAAPYDAAGCTPTDRVALLQVHGTWDTTIFYDGRSRHTGDPNAELVAPRACMATRCTKPYDTCENQASCREVFDCIDGCDAQANPTACAQTCFDNAPQDGQFSFMETFVCGLAEDCYMDPREDWEGYASAEAGAARWAEYNGCGDTTSTFGRLDIVKDLPEDETRRDTFDGCPSDGPVEVWTIEYGGHIPQFNANWARSAIDWLMRAR